MPTNDSPKIVTRVEDLESRYTENGLNTSVFPISDSVSSSRSDIAASSKAAKKAYDDGTRSATTTDKGQVILSHDVDSGEDDKALTPFGASKSLQDLQQQINNQFKQVINYIDQKFVELENKIQTNLPLFDSYQMASTKDNAVIAPSTGRVWMYYVTERIPISTPGAGADDSSWSQTDLVIRVGFAAGGSQIQPQKPFGNATFVHMWRVFE